MRVISPHYVNKSPQLSVAGLRPLQYRSPLTLLFAIAILVVALSLPRGFATSVVYIPLVLCGLSFPRPAATLVLATIATALSLIYFSLPKPVSVAPWMASAHQASYVVTIWLTAIVVYQHRKSLLRLKAVQDRAAFLANIVEYTNDAVIGITGAGIIQSWNSGAEKMFGFRADERIGHPAGLLIHDFAVGTGGEIEDYLRGQIGLRNCEGFCICKNNARLDVLITTSPILDANGNFIGISQIIRDNTESKSMLAQIQQADERFQKIIEFSPYSIVVIDENGQILLTNRQTESLLGYTQDELFKNNVELLIPERYRGMHPQHRDHFFSTRALETQSYAMARGTSLFALRKDGSETPVEIGLIPIQTATRSYVLCTIIDITPRLAIEAQTRQFQDDLKRQVEERTAQLAASNRELEDFASFASHDLKAPLRGIRTIAGFLAEDLEAHLTETSRGHITLLNARIQRMEKLLDDLLSYARLRDPDNARSDERLGCDVLLHEIIGLLAPPEHFRFSLTGPLAEIVVRRMPLQQVLMNLLSNAVKHNHKPAGNIAVSVEDTGNEYRWTVADDGPGIPKKFQDRVFKMFQTLKPRDQVEGSGMGLAVVRKHVESVGGVLTLQSEENQGCAFSFTWPK